MFQLEAQMNIKLYDTKSACLSASVGRYRNGGPAFSLTYRYFHHLYIIRGNNDTFFGINKIHTFQYYIWYCYKIHIFKIISILIHKSLILLEQLLSWSRYTIMGTLSLLHFIIMNRYFKYFLNVLKKWSLYLCPTALCLFTK